MANKILVARGTKARIEAIKSTLATNELVYATDTGELGVKKANGSVEYFMNARVMNGIVEGLMGLLDSKVDEVPGKGLSTNDYTDADKSKVDSIDQVFTSAEKAKLAGIEAGAQKNSSITKAEIEAKLTGVITSHSHALPTHAHDDRYYTQEQVEVLISDAIGAINAILGDIDTALANILGV